MVYKSQQEYKGINWEDVRKKYEKIRDPLIEGYPAEEADIERFPNGAKTEEVT